MTNPVDELAEIREKKRLLSEREKELREIIISDVEARTGSNYIARVSQQTVTRTDWQELAMSLGATDEDVEKFSSELTRQVVRLESAKPRTKRAGGIDHGDILNRLTSRRLVILDVETTGLYARRGDRVIQLALLPITIDKLGNCSKGNEYSTYVNPIGRRSHPDAQARHNIDESLLRSAPTFEKKCEEFLKLIEDCTLVIHNAEFDLGFLFCELDRLGRPEIENDAICTLALAKSLWPRERCTLEALVKKFGIDVEQIDFHDALGDVRALGALLPHLFASIQKL